MTTYRRRSCEHRSLVLNCTACRVLIDAAIERAKQSGPPCCGVCWEIGHVSKFCPTTAVGRARAIALDKSITRVEVG
jgi:hypothetical protein